MYKNVASQYVIVFAWDNAAGAPKSGDATNITGRVSKDSIDSAATNDVNPTEIANAAGQYAFLMTQGETNCDLHGLTASSSTADVDIQPVIIYTRPAADIDWQNGGRLDLILDIIAADTTTDIPALIATAQADLDIITGASGVNLLTATQASIDAIETVTDKFVFTVANQVDSNIQYINDAQVIGDGNAAPWNGA